MKRHIIIGASAAGMGVLSKLRALAPNDTIICITAQPEMPYNTCLLANYLGTSEMPRGLFTKPESFFTTHNIQLYRNTRVIDLNTQTRTITCDNATTLSYDTLFLGLGTSPLWLPGMPPNLKNVFRFHTLDDTEQLRAYIAQKPKTALIIGGGLSGVECADALTERGISVTLVEAAQHLLPTLLSHEGSTLLQHHMQAAGSTVHTATRVVRIIHNTERAQGVELANGTILPADMIVSAIGTKSNVALAQSAGIVCRDNAIIVDHTMRTSDPSVFSGGDVALVPSSQPGVWVKSCTWPDAMQHGMIAAHHMAGGSSVFYQGLTPVMSSVFYGTQFVSCGPVVAPPRDAIVHQRSGINWHHTFITKGSSLLGFMMLGNVHSVGALRILVATQEAYNPTLFDKTA